MDVHRLARLLQLIEQNDPLANSDVADTPDQRRRRDALIFEALAVAIACGYDAGIRLSHGDTYAILWLPVDGWAAWWYVSGIVGRRPEETKTTYVMTHRFISAVARGGVK